MTDEQKKRKGLKKAIEYYPQQERMLRAVCSLLEWQNMIDINNHGINGGYSGFIYYSDTERFARKHRKAIVALIEYEAQEFCESIESFLGGFNCFDFKDKQEKKECMLYVYGGATNKFETLVLNGFAWYAGEWASRIITELAEEE
jgi:hypothetical protein